MEQLDIEDRLYDRQYGMAGLLYECEPIGFGDLVTREEMQALVAYYFLGREVDVDSIYEYRRQLTDGHPEVRARAEGALRKVMAAYKVDRRELRDVFDATPPD